MKELIEKLKGLTRWDLEAAQDYGYPVLHISADMVSGRWVQVADLETLIEEYEEEVCGYRAGSEWTDESSGEKYVYDGVKFNYFMWEDECLNTSHKDVKKRWEDTKPNLKDTPTNPAHYKQGDKEAWEEMLEIWGAEKFKAFCEMNAYKYMKRLGKKPNNPVEQDLEKARWYLNKARELD